MSLHCGFTPHVDSRVRNFHPQRAQCEVLVGKLKERALLEGFSVVDTVMLKKVCVCVCVCV